MWKQQSIESSMNRLGIKVAMGGLPVGVEGTEGPTAEGELDKCKEFGQAIAGKLE